MVVVIVGGDRAMIVVTLEIMIVKEVVVEGFGGLKFLCDIVSGLVCIIFYTISLVEFKDCSCKINP